MTHEIARILAGRLKPLHEQKVLTTLAGLVKTATVKNEKDTIRFPVPFDLDSAPASIQTAELVPDGKQRAILYFEGNDATVTESIPQRTRMQAALRLICWYNVDKYELSGDKAETIHTVLLAGVINHLHNGLTVPSTLQISKMELGRVLDSTASLFNRYTYREERAQYLQHPYYAFGIDLSVKFQLNHACHDGLLTVDTANC